MTTAVCGGGRPAAPLEFYGSAKLKNPGGTVAATVDARVTLQLDYRRYPEPLVEGP
jgi:hypothetical protein